MTTIALQQRELAQARPAGTSAVQVYQPNSIAVITTIIVANTTGSSANYSIYLDKDGTTYTEATALFYSVALAANTTALIEFANGVPITSVGNLAVQTGTGSAITFTVYGMEKV